MYDNVQIRCCLVLHLLETEQMSGDPDASTWNHQIFLRPLEDVKH